MNWCRVVAAPTLLLALAVAVAGTLEMSQGEMVEVTPDDSGSCFTHDDTYDGEMQCSEVSDDGLHLRCYLLYRALDYVPFYRFGFAMQVTFTLRLMSAVQQPFHNSDNERTDEKIQGNEHDDEQIICWSLEAIEVSRVEDATEVDWRYKRMYLDTFGKFLLLYPTKEFRMSAKYPSTTPAVMTSVNTTCWSYQRSANCIKSEKISKNVMLPGIDIDRNSYSDGYWDDVRKMHLQDLKADNITFLLQIHDYNNNTAFFVEHYIQPIVKNISFESIHLEKVNLTGLDLGTQLKLKELKVVESMLTAYDAERLISSSPNLESLNLTCNNMTYIPAGISELRNLKKLDLSYNSMTMSHSPSAISFERNLKVLNIAGNKITNISTLDHLIANCQLLFLNASKCSLSELEIGSHFSALRHQRELIVLDLSLNNLNGLPKDIFVEMNQLKLLQLSYNHLHQDLRLNLPQSGINILDLSHNNLETPENLVQTGKARTVILKGNDIYPWHNSSIFVKRTKFSETWLEKLDISDCKINVVNEEMLQSFDYLKEVDLGANPFDCLDCSMPLFKTWLQSKYEDSSESYPKLVNHGIKKVLTCVHPEGFAGKSILSAVDPDCRPNYIVTVGVPVIVILALSALSFGVLYFYRYEITYIMHLVKMRKLRLANASMIKSFQYDAFVCYSGKDRNWVMKKLVPQLENGPQKYSLCLHERDFILGSIITRNIASFMQQSKNMIVVLTTNFVNSHWCQWELEMANHKVFAENREFLIFIELERLERQKLPQHLRYLMDTRTYLEWPLPEDMNLETESILWRRLRISMGPSIAQIKSGFKRQTD